jgi:signal transduction histidine kinase
MHFLQALPTLITVVALAFMGFLVFRNSRELANKLFLLFVLTDTLWLLSVSLITTSTLGTNVYLGRFAYAIAILLLMMTQAFTNELLHLQFRHNKLYLFFMYGVGGVFTLVTLLTNLVIKSIVINESLPFPKYGMLYPLIMGYIAAAVVIFFIVLVERWLSLGGQRNGMARRQLDLVASGLTIFGVVSVLTNLILPAILGQSWPVRFMPFGSFVLGLTFFYAISKYRLFDIRGAVVRSTTYVLLIAVLGGLFVLTANIGGALLTSSHNHGQQFQQVFNLLIALIIAISFHLLRVLFDKVTDRIFFQDSYDPQRLFNDFNQGLVSTIELEELLKTASEIIVRYLKSDYCVVVLRTKSSHQPRVIGTTSKSFSHHDLAIAHDRHFVGHSDLPPVISKDSLGAGYEGLGQVLAANNISIIARLNANDNVRLGHLIIGSKKSGNPYNAQDMRIVETLANELVIAIQNALRFEEIEQFNATLQEKVDDATKRLRQTNAKLRTLDETKDDFISMASHQLRTPLTSVKGYVSMVLDGDAGKISPLQRKLLTQSFVSSQRMVYLISDLLNLSRLRTGKFIIEATPCNLADIVKGEIEQLVETAKARELTLVYNKPDHFPTYMLDETKLRQVIMNFVDNAIYYTPSGGTIEVNLVDRPESIELTVVDNGIGVPKAEQHHLFTKFFRAHNAKRARPDGTGLGLFMAKKVVIAQGGAIVFKSQEGKGSTFGFTFAKSKLVQLPKPTA